MNLNPLAVTQNTDSLTQSDYLYFLQLDKGGGILFANCKFINQTPLFSTSAECHSIADFLFPNDFLNYQIKLKMALESGQRNFMMELRKIKPDGSDFHWTKWEFSITENTFGEVQIAGIGHDIQKTNEKNLSFPEFVYGYQIKNEIMEGLFENDLIGYWIWDIEEGKDHMSNSLKEMLGYADFQDFRNGVRWQNHIHEEDKEKVDRSINEHFNSSGNDPFHCDLRLKTLIGPELWVIGYGKVIKWGQDGRPLSMAGCFFDISEKKKSEFLLEKQSQFLKNLTFNQSHLMRSKLANIMGILEVMDLTNCNKDINSYVNIINQEAKKLDEVLKESINSSSAFDNNFSPI